MKTSIACILAAMMLMLASSLYSQEKFGIEVRGGAAFATSDLGDADLKPGFGFEGLLDYRITPHVGVFAGWGWNRFSSETSFAGRNVDFEETGYLFGLQLNTAGSTALNAYLRAGGLYNHLETESEAGDIIADSGHGLGWRIEAGVEVALGNSWYLKPGVKYQALDRELTVENITTPVELRYFSIGLGIAKRF